MLAVADAVVGYFLFLKPKPSPTRVSVPSSPPQNGVLGETGVSDRLVAPPPVAVPPDLSQRTDSRNSGVTRYQAEMNGAVSWYEIKESPDGEVGLYNQQPGQWTLSGRVLSISDQSITVALNTSPDCVDRLDEDGSLSWSGMRCGSDMTFQYDGNVEFIPAWWNITRPPKLIGSSQDIQVGDKVMIVAQPETIRSAQGTAQRVVGYQ